MNTIQNMRANTRVVFMGTPEFAVPSLNALLDAGYSIVGVVTVPDRKAGRGQKLTASAVKQYAEEKGIPVLQPEKMKDEVFLQQLEAWQADLFIVVAFRMLPKQVWGMPRLGTFNLHASLLPSYRGAAPINWAIINGEKRTGLTTFLLNERIDDGAIILQEETAIDPEDNAGSLHDRLSEMGRSLVVRTADLLASGSAQPHPQQLPSDAPAAPKIFKSDCEIDWNRPGREVVNLVRGLSPYPAAYTTFETDKGEFLSCKIFDVSFEPNSSPTPGTITTDNKKHLKIAVKGGFISIYSLQLNGRKRISTEEFLRGYSIADWSIALCKG